MLVNMNDVLFPAKKNKYAVGLFNAVNLELARGIIGAAESMRAPVIIGTAEVLFPYGPLEEVSYYLIPMAKKADVPVVVHLDHGLKKETCLKALELGFSSIMYDCSTDSYEDNVKKVKEMADKKKLVSEITSMDVDFAQWYTDIVKKAEMADYSSVKGCIIMRPYAQALWENIQHTLDTMFKETGHENVAMPIFIPESLLQKEADHVEGFAPECAWVTHGGNDKLEERLCVRPTSETLFCEHYAKIVRSWRDLPKL